VTNEQIEELATQAGFTRIRLKGERHVIFNRGRDMLRISSGSEWNFYPEIAGTLPEKSGSDHGSLAEFLNAQIAKAS
jgi:hypothetical protein